MLMAKSEKKEEEKITAKDKGKPQENEKKETNAAPIKEETP